MNAERAAGKSMDPTMAKERRLGGSSSGTFTDVADDRINFGTIETGDEVCKYLNEYTWKGPVPKPRMAQV